jgi:hypothetical protein
MGLITVRNSKEASIYSYVKQAGLPAALSQEAPAFLASFVIAEVFYKFHSFTLEYAAFLATWYASSWGQSKLFGPRAR